MGTYADLHAAVRIVGERPVRLTAGALVGALEVATWLLFAGAVWIANGDGGTVAVLLTRVLLIAGVGALAPGCYAVVRSDDESVRAASSRVRSAVERDGATVLSAAIVAHGAGLAIAAAAWVLLSGAGLALDAVLQSIVAATGPDTWAAGPDRGAWAFAVAALLVGTLVRPLLAFHDLAVLDGGAGPRTAWLSSVRATTARPRSLPSYAIVRWTLLAVPVLVTLVMAALSGVVLAAVGAPSGVVGPIVVTTVAALTYVGASAVTRTVLAAYHDRVATERFAVGESPVGDGPRTAGTATPPGRGTLAATILVLATLTGAGVGLRVADVGPGAAPPSAGAADELGPTDALHRAYRRTASTAHVERVRTTAGGDSNGDGVVRSRLLLRVDPGDRQVLATRTRPSGATDGRTYVEEGLSARYGATESALDVHVDRDALRRGEWRVQPASPTEAAVPDAWFYPTHGAADWSRRDSGSGPIVYELTDPEYLEDLEGVHLPEFTYDGEDVTYLDGSHVRVGVNRSTGRLEWIRARAHYRRSDPEDPSDSTELVDRRVDAEFEGYGTTDVARPTPLDSPPIESRLQDALGY